MNCYLLELENVSVMKRLQLNEKTSIVTAVFSAVTLKLCCWGPLLLTGVFGFAGSSSYFSWLQLYKPWFLGIAWLSLGYSFYQVYKTQRLNCECTEVEMYKKSAIRKKIVVWLVAVFVLIMTIISFYPALLTKHRFKDVIVSPVVPLANTTFIIKGMSCGGCEANVNQAISPIKGVFSIETSFKKSTATIMFDSTKVSVKMLREAIVNKGYIVSSPD